MTNRMIIQDAMLGNLPTDHRTWTGVQRQLAEDTAPGYMSRVLLTDQAFTSTTFADINNLALSLMANVRYWWEFTGMYVRTGTDDAKAIFSFTGNAATSGDQGRLMYLDSAAAEATTVSYDPFTSVALGTDGSDQTFYASGWFSCTTAGILTAQFGQNANSGVNDVTLYAGTRLIFQPIINLAFASNP